MSANELTHHQEAELLEVALWGLQAQSQHSSIDPHQFEVLIMLASDVEGELERIEEEEYAKESDSSPRTPPAPVSVAN